MTVKASSFTIEGSSCDAVLFDLDGVVTKTAKVHATAWKRLFDGYLEERIGDSFQPFDVDADYHRYVDGKPRYEGVKSFLRSRDIDLPYGSPDDPPDKETVCGLGNKKNWLFLEHLEAHGVEVYDATVDLIRKLRKEGFKTAIVSSSKNCEDVLESAGITGLFDARVDGVVSEEKGLKGKPAPDIFLEAARRLGAAPARSIVVEDAISGVTAGKRGGFGHVIGVDRVGQAAALREGGADVVVGDLAEIAVREGRLSGAEDLPSALDRMDEITRMVIRKKMAVFLDYDGTLTPIVRRPEDARLAERTRKVIETLANLCTIAVISGRDLADVKNLVGIDGIFYAGSHGFDVSGPKDLKQASQKGVEFLPILDRAERDLRERLGGIKGCLVERKKFAIAVHYRLVEEMDLEDVKRSVSEAAEKFPSLRRSSGKKIYELQPNIDWNKGKALLWLLEVLDLDTPDAFPLYIGDDTTDEDAFKVLVHSGIGIIVRDGSKPTAARYALENPDQVRQFLERLISVVRGGCS